MSTLNISRGETQVNYLTTSDKYGQMSHVEMGRPGSAARFGVLRFSDGTSSQVVLKVDGGAFQLWSGLTRDEARLLALALNTACDEAEAAS